MSIIISYGKPRADQKFRTTFSKKNITLEGKFVNIFSALFMITCPKSRKSIFFLLIRPFKNCNSKTGAIASSILILLLIHFQVYSQTDQAGSGRALRFDGVDDYVDLGNIYDNVALPVTMSAWIYIDPIASIETFPIFDSQDNSTDYNGFTMITSTTPHIGVTYGDGQGGNNPAFRRSKSGFFQFLTGRWVHITGVIRGADDMDVYLNGYNIDGQYVGSSNLPMNSTSPTEVAKIGKVFSNGLTFHFKGIMDELRVWNKSLTEAEVREQMCRKLSGNEPGLIGYWNFDETSGNILNDKSPNHFHGQLKGNPTRVFSGAPIGDESVFLYGDSWNTKTLSMSDGADKIEVSGVTSDPFGVHIFKVNSIPSQKGDLPPGVSQPYFGVFTASDNVNTTFDIHYSEDDQPVCALFSRNDNSIPTWTGENSASSDFLNRREFIKATAQNNVSIDLGNDQLVCSVQPRVLSPVNDPTGLEFTWQDGSTQPTFPVSDFGLYWVKVKSACGVATDSISFSQISEDITIDLGEDQERCSIQPRVLTPVADPSGLEFTWQDGSKQSTFTVSDFGVYWVTVKGACTSVRDSIRFSKITVEEDAIPNVITPNGDHLNDYFMIDKKLAGMLSMQIVNRWGKEVYSTDHYTNNWGGEGLSSGIYYYVLSGECLQAKGIIHVLK
jgi:gliding motility-associated-like protein